ncbi:uncharacterized protein LOC123548573 [Mercenaria mercenaria]|uniref:uncharacterized protein LOC123548573 n=1 Tax=Mercenaria mercenaria TaxID=6596 RepID=UPI00234E437B|nr:uncharacterized protein LOC123548573 [Mercenaria mercenaria]
MLKYQTCLVILLSSVFQASTMIQKLDMPGGLQSYFNGAKLQHNVSDVTGEQIFWECMQRVMWQMAEQMGHNVTRETRDYLDRLLQIAVDSIDTQFPRIRKEYRMMSDAERDRFHKSILALKEDTTLKPNVYTAIAELHAGEVIPMAHFGAGFPGWHRVFLLIFETALRMKDPSVSIPYWASNLDSEMDDPTMSVIWSDKFFGNGDGFVTTGPFADFKIHSSGSILTRNIGSSGSLMTNKGIHGILSQNHTRDIVSPTAPQAHNLELQHNTVHAWMGGNMDDLSTSAEDPVFFLHHSFVDYLWEEFRTKQKMLGIDPEIDYPVDNWGDDSHAPEAIIGFGDLRNVDALSNVLANMVKYDPSPVCTRSHPTCISKYLKCDTSKSHPICVSLSREEIEGDKVRDNEICVEAHLTRAVQNTFAINQYCDMRKWSYIPVKIVLQRPPEFTNYKAYPVFNNRPVTTADVFSTISINKTISGKLAAYPNCKLTSSVARKIYVESYGLNYYGKYKDFTVLDQRHALSSAVTYLGVKSPDSNFTDVIVYAFDYCGRTCRPFCLDRSVNPPKSSPCSGVIRITPDEPKLYGNNYADSVNGVWTAEHPDDLPVDASDPVFITFYCDYSGVWPWDEDLQRKTHGRRNSPKQNLKSKPVLRETSSINSVIKPKMNVVRKIKPVRKGAKKIRAKIQSKSTRRITIIKVRPKRPPATTPKPALRHIPSFRVIDLSSATSRPPKSHKQTNLNKRFGKTRAIYPKRMPLPQKRLFTPRNIHLEFQRQKGAPKGRFPPRDNCRLNPGCFLSVPCSPCQHKSRQPCRSPSRMIAICVNGIYMLEPLFFNFMG